MDYTWRPTPQSSGSFCPVCSNPHFPFCPPLPSQYYRPPPPGQFFHHHLPPPPAPAPAPAPAPKPSYDPSVDHHGGPTINPYPQPPSQIPPRPWGANPNFSTDYYGHLNPGLDYENNGPIGAKRMRFNNVSDNYAGLLTEDERRLKLMRQHGAPSHGYPNHSFEQSNIGGNMGDFGDRKFQNHHGERQFAYQQIESNKNHGYGNIVHQADMYKNFKQPGPNNETRPSDHSIQLHIKEPNLGHRGLPNQPPLPNSPPPPLPIEPPRIRFLEPVVSSSFQSPYAMVSESSISMSTHYTSKAHPSSSGYYPNSSENPYRDLSLDKPKVIDVSHILKHPHRADRPDHIVIILRGLPGSGKSYLAKTLRDLEIENGGTAPRIHSMDEYFMTEVEENEGPRSSGSVRGKKPVVKKVMEYCYEPEMEEAYRSSMLKAFKKTLDEGAFPFVIDAVYSAIDPFLPGILFLVLVDDRNLRVADFDQFWATAKRSGYEVYLLEATYTDPAGCAARNVHGFTQNEIHKMSSQWEEATSLYMKLDIKSLLHGDDLEENGIQEVDMDTEDGSHVSGPSGSSIETVARPSDGDLTCDVPLKNDERKRDDDAEETPLEVVKELRKSKWSNDLDEDDLHKAEARRSNSSSLSSLTITYSKKGKSVRWADQIGRNGFSIGAGKAANVSLVIGGGSGYNLKSNPLPEEDKLGQRSTEPKRRNAFQQQLRAEHESFRAVFDKRKQRINGT